MKTEDQQALYLIRGVIASMPEDDQARVRTAAAQLRDVIAASGQHGLIALALVAAENQDELS